MGTPTGYILTSYDSQCCVKPCSIHSERVFTLKLKVTIRLSCNLDEDTHFKKDEGVLVAVGKG